jgi:hypothetical protein
MQRIKWSALAEDFGLSKSYIYDVFRGRRKNSAVEAKIAELRAAGALPFERKKTAAPVESHSSKPASIAQPFRPVILAIDPGASGGIAEREGAEYFCTKMPKTEGDILCWLRLRVPRVAVIEDQVGCVGPGIKVSSASMFSFGRHFGFVLGSLQSQGWRIHLVRPQKWQSALSLGKRRDSASQTEWKNKLKQRAQQLYPGIDVTLNTADALLLLHYAIQEGLN